MSTYRCTIDSRHAIDNHEKNDAQTFSEAQLDQNESTAAEERNFLLGWLPEKSCHPCPDNLRQVSNWLPFVPARRIASRKRNPSRKSDQRIDTFESEKVPRQISSPVAVARMPSNGSLSGANHFKKSFMRIAWALLTSRFVSLDERIFKGDGHPTPNSSH